MDEFNERYMKEAIKQAKKAAELGETPVGAVIVKDNKIIARGYNSRESKKKATGHAEITAIERACKKLGGWRLPDTSMYVTLEPCPMCSGAVIAARIDRLYFGAYDKKAGCCGSKCNLFVPGMFNYKADVVGGIMEEECAGLLKEFFKDLRRRKI
ncbi:MAG: tRNA adenosine(34) deaminase TadA [Oscillospiraceae bacterium]|nr:tRNA adenosine(34) deaminase TadA [Oscillospiraceae bacterium]